MKDILILIKDNKTTKNKKEHLLILLDRSRKTEFPIYSLTLLVNSISKKPCKIISSEGWIENDFGLHQKRKLLKKEQEVHKKVTVEFEKNKKEALLVKKKHLFIPAIIALFLLVFFVGIPSYKSIKENKVWTKSKLENTMSSYEYYINRYPKGKYYNDALLQKEILTGVEKGNTEKLKEKQNSPLKYYDIEDIGIIEDPDGYTNVRIAGNKSSKVITTVKENEQFKIIDKTSNWWKIITKDSIIGYMHLSRIKIVRENAYGE